MVLLVLLNDSKYYNTATIIPGPLPEKVLQTSSRAISLQEVVMQTVSGMGMGMSVMAESLCLEFLLHEDTSRGREDQKRGIRQINLFK